MAYKYINLGKEVIINKLRDIRYANGERLYGLNNVVQINYQFNADPLHLAIQADVFARAMMTHRSKIDLKRILGSYQRDWLRILNEAYVYSFCKSVYYGLKAVDLYEYPNNLVAFPGHIFLMNVLAIKQFSYESADSQPYSIYIKIVNDKTIKELLDPIFEIYPDVAEGMSDRSLHVSYVNTTYESVLNGLFNWTKIPMKGKNGESLFFINKMDDMTIQSMTNQESNPILNSHLSEDLEKFYFINPVSNSGPNKMRFNESLFISRAIGIVSNQLEVDDNTFYNVAKRDPVGDYLTKEEVYAVCGLKTDTIPLSMEQIQTYLQMNSYKSNGDLDPEEELV